jgi:hypothetical protein
MAETEEVRERAQSELSAFSSFNNGLGIVVPMAMAERLRELGVDGPFVESKFIPEVANASH